MLSHMTFQGPFHPQPFSDSVNSQPFTQTMKYKNSLTNQVYHHQYPPSWKYKHLQQLTYQTSQNPTVYPTLQFHKQGTETTSVHGSRLECKKEIKPSPPVSRLSLLTTGMKNTELFQPPRRQYSMFCNFYSICIAEFTIQTKIGTFSKSNVQVIGLTEISAL